VKALIDHFPNGCWLQPDGGYSGECTCGTTFAGGTYPEAKAAWASHAALATTPSPDASPDSGEAVTLFREVDALGGTGMPEEGESWSRGYSEALSDVLSILAKRGFSEQLDARASPSPAIVKEAGEVERLTGDILFDAFMVGDVSRLTTTALPGSLRSMQSSYQRAWDDLAAALSASNAAQVSK